MRKHLRDRMMRTEALENREGASVAPELPPPAIPRDRANYAASENPMRCPECGFTGSRVREVSTPIATAAGACRLRTRICGQCRRPWKTTAPA